MIADWYRKFPTGRKIPIMSNCHIKRNVIQPSMRRNECASFDDPLRHDGKVFDETSDHPAHRHGEYQAVQKRTKPERSADIKEEASYKQIRQHKHENFIGRTAIDNEKVFDKEDEVEESGKENRGEDARLLDEREQKKNQKGHRNLSGARDWDEVEIERDDEEEPDRDEGRCPPREAKNDGPKN